MRCPGVDAAVVVCEPEPAKVQMLKPYLKRLADLRIPHFLFVNKIDKASGSLRDMLRHAAGSERHAASAAPDSDLGKRASSPASSIWRWSAPTSIAHMRALRDDRHQPIRTREKEARFAMLEKLADYDEHLMEELLSDVEPPRDEVFGDLERELARRSGRAGADRLGRGRQRHPAAAEGVAPRSAGCFRSRGAPRHARQRRRRVVQVAEDLSFRAWRQA